MKEYYEILGLNPGASQEQIDEAYNKLSVELNPKNNNNAEFFKEEYAKVINAYNSISNKTIVTTEKIELHSRTLNEVPSSSYDDTSEDKNSSNSENFITIKVPINKLNEDQDEFNPDYVSPNQPLIKKRHGCVTTWLVFMIISNLFAMLINFNAGLSFLAFLGLLGIVSAVLLFQWSIKGFFIFTIICVIAFIINLSYQIPIGSAFTGLVSPIILWAIFQFKSNDVSAWDNLE